MDDGELPHIAQLHRNDTHKHMKGLSQVLSQICIISMCMRAIMKAMVCLALLAEYIPKWTNVSL